MLPSRGIDVLMCWHETNKQKKESEFRKQGRRHIDLINDHLQRAGHYLAKGSAKYLIAKENSDQPVEERLLTFGSIVTAKREQ